jgi:predicted HicB family RNase H-like nuclease
VRDMAEPKKRLIRLPRELDARIEKAAKEEGASVNTFITAVLAAAVGYRLPKK